MALPVMSIGILLLSSFFAGSVQGQEAQPPRELKVLPILFVPKGETPPTDDMLKRLQRHLEWSQTRYRELLGNQSTFTIANQQPVVYKATRNLTFYRAQPEDAAPQIVSELLQELKVNRYNCPYILLTVVINPINNWPAGGGRPLNGGLNTGGGFLEVSSYALVHSPNFQSTLQHELGHSFGLPHVDAYKYDMKQNDSIMSYNPKHHTLGFEASPTPGKLIPEDLRALALNSRALPNVTFDPKKDIPAGYAMAEWIATLGPMKIPGQPDVKVTSTFGNDFNSNVANIVQGKIQPSKRTGKVTFDPPTMWQSGKTTTGWVSVDVTFPYSIGLTQVVVHSQHSGEYHAAKAARVSVQEGGRFRKLAESELKTIDDSVAFEKATGKVWRFEFRTDKGGAVVIRGLQFFSGEDELFPPLLPYQP
jgi:hypothetical protein